MSEDEVLLGSFDPEWMSTGGISGGEETDPQFDDDTLFQGVSTSSSAGGDPLAREDTSSRPRQRRPLRNWDTTVRSRQNQAPEDFIGGACP